MGGFFFVCCRRVWGASFITGGIKMGKLKTKGIDNKCFVEKTIFFFVLKKIFKRRKMADMDKMTNCFFFLVL